MSKTTNTLANATTELAYLMKTNPSAVEKEILDLGENLIGIFSDGNFSTRRFGNLNQQKVEILTKTIDDVSSGVMILRSSTIGLSYRDNKLTSFVSPHGTPPPGTLVYSVSWKNIAAFKAWRFEDGEGEDVSQESINAAIYYLTFKLSQLL